MIDVDPPELAALPRAYHELFARVMAAVAEDERVRAVWLSGSLGRRTADAGSDLDLLLAVRDEDFSAFTAGWREWLESITPVLLADTIPRSDLIFSALTEDLCRLDGVIEPVSRVPESPHRTRVAVLDRDGLDAEVGEPPVRPGPDPARITALITEFWRIESIFPAMVDGRRDLLCAKQGVEAGWRLLDDVFVESNQPLPVTGVKQVTSKLTPDQVAVLTDLPVAGPDRDQLIIANTAVCRAMATAGRAAAERVGATYPERIADAVTAHLARLS